jgi:hypothetical protein
VAAAPGAKGRVRRTGPSDNASAALCHLRRAAAAEIGDDLIFRAKVRELHGRGPRLTYELLAEIGAEHLIHHDIEQRINRYLSIPDEMLDLLDARRMPSPPLRVVRS